MEVPIQDGVPDECGVHLVRHKEAKMPKWFPVTISIRAEDSKLIANKDITNVDDPWIEEDEFDEYYWSVKLDGPKYVGKENNN